MRKLNLTIPRQISEQLCLLCADSPKACKKDGALGWISNDRIIIVRKGFFQYYNFHSGFVQDDPLTLNPKQFKASVRLDLIQEMNYLPRNKIRKNMIQLIFPSACIARQPSEAFIAEQPLQKKIEDNQLQKWIFQFKIDIKEYVQQRRQEYRQQQRLLAGIQKNLGQFNSKGMKTSNHAPPILNQDDDLQNNIEVYVESVQRTKEFLKTKAELAEEEAARLRKKKEKERTELISSKSQSSDDSYLISPFWREYFKMFEQVLIDKRRPNRIETQIKMLKLIESFNDAATKIVKNYIEERGVGWDGSRKNMADFHYYQGLWLRVGGKQLNQQFLVNYNINDILYSLSEIKNMKFRVPLMTLIKYRGMKVLVMCNMPFSQLEKSEIYNLLSDGFDLQLMGKIKEGLEVIEDILNVKSYPIEVDPKRIIQAPLGLHLHIYQYNFNKDKSQDQATLPNFYYLINPGFVFPIDFNAQRQSPESLARLRPQLVATYRDYVRDDPHLLSQAFMVSSMPEELKRSEEEKLLSASNFLSSGKLKELMMKLNRIDLLIVDSYSLKTIMHQMGINVRYLYLIYQLAEIPYIREHVLAEALARTIKKEFRSALFSIEQQKLNNSQNQYLKMRNNERLAAIRDRIIQSDDIYQDIAIDFLNLTFGKGPETEEFWKIINQKCKKHYKIEGTFPPKVKPGLLLHAVLWQCGLNAFFSMGIPLFQSERPFTRDSKVQYRVELKTYDFPSFEIQKLFRSAPSIEDQVTMQVYEQSTKKLLKLQLLFYNTLKFNFNAALAICKMHNFHQYLSKFELQNPMHPVLIPFYISNKSQYNFHRALDVIKFALPETHPLYVSVYSEYSGMLQPQLLKKTAIMMAVKNFGQYHTKTTQLYSVLYHEGNNQYGLKAKRIVTVEACYTVSKEMFQDEKYQACLDYVEKHIAKFKEPNSPKIGSGNYQKYIKMLMQGLESAIHTISFKRGILISQEVSNVISAFKVQDLKLTYDLFRQVLIMHMLMAPKKYFLYKMVLLAVHIRLNHEKAELDKDGCTQPVGEKQQIAFLQGLSQEYYPFENHSNWVKYVIDTLLRSFQYFNFLEDLFNNYQAHIHRFSNDTWRQALSFLDILIRVYGQHLFKSNLYEVRFN